MNYVSIKKVGNVAGIVMVVFFGLCVSWGLVLVEPALKELHLNILRIAFPGFSMSFVGILVGAVESFIYGWFFGALFAWLCKKVCVSDK